MVDATELLVQFFTIVGTMTPFLLGIFRSWVKQGERLIRIETMLEEIQRRLNRVETYEQH